MKNSANLGEMMLQAEQMKKKIMSINQTHIIVHPSAQYAITVNTVENTVRKKTYFRCLFVALKFLCSYVFFSVAYSQELPMIMEKKQSIATGNTVMNHSHMPVLVPENVKTPQLSISIYPDAMSGYNLLIDTQNYQLTPPPSYQVNMMELMKATVNQTNGFVEGHAHLYVNGTKIQRVYGKSVYLPPELFRSGVNQITISINNHAHMYWVAEKKQILATIFMLDDGQPTIKYSFESFPVVDSS